MSIVSRRCDGCQELIPPDGRRIIVSIGIYDTSGASPVCSSIDNDACSYTCARLILIRTTNEAPRE